MSNYLRATRECNVTQLRPELQQALHQRYRAVVTSLTGDAA